MCQYYPPEEIGTWQVHELTSGLVQHGHRVTALTAFPHYIKGRIYEGYRGRLSMREEMDGVDVLRTWLYATPSKRMSARLANYASFCATALAAGLTRCKRPDVVYTWLPPLPLGVVGALIAKAKRARYVLHVQDIYPRGAVELGLLTNPRVIRFFERMERWVYRQAHHIIVIADGFRDDLLSKGVPAEKLTVVPNWSDPESFTPGPRENGFRQSADPGERMLVIYSGGLTLNSYLDTLIDAAALLRHEPFLFLLVGEGVHKERLMQKADALGLDNVRFLPFQPASAYPDTLRAADVMVATLHPRASLISLPSKIYKQMAAGRPMLTIAPEGSDLARTIREAGCGVVVEPDDAQAAAEALRSLRANPGVLEEMGRNARRALETHYSRAICLDAINRVVRKTCGRETT
jgi:colanic acid biosynthesis glycosyl transferase WcaI